MERSIQKGIDGGSVASITYDPMSGGKKIVKMGPHLTFMPYTEDGYVNVKKGATVYIFNTSTELQWLAMFDKKPDEALTDMNFQSNCYPLKPMDWTVLSCGAREILFTSSKDDIGIYVAYDSTTLK